MPKMAFSSAAPVDGSRKRRKIIHDSSSEDEAQAVSPAMAEVNAAEKPVEATTNVIEDAVPSSLTVCRDIRDIVTCKICLRLLHEPYMNPCGHTFCYSCLDNWFASATGPRTCPDCRAHVRQEPSPAYLIRNIVQRLVNDAFTNETNDSTDQAEESRVVEDARAQGHLFKGRFSTSILSRPAPRLGLGALIHDTEDGVLRCPECAWEFERGATECERCGFSPFDGLGDSDGLSSGMDAWSGSDGLDPHEAFMHREALREATGIISAHAGMLQAPWAAPPSVSHSTPTLSSRFPLHRRPPGIPFGAYIDEPLQAPPRRRDHAEMIQRSNRSLTYGTDLQSATEETDDDSLDVDPSDDDPSDDDADLDDDPEGEMDGFVIDDDDVDEEDEEDDELDSLALADFGDDTSSESDNSQYHETYEHSTPSSLPIPALAVRGNRRIVQSDSESPSDNPSDSDSA